MDTNIIIEKNIEKINTDLGFKSVALKDTNIVCENTIMKENIDIVIDVESVKRNINDTSVGDKSVVILDDTPVVPRRIRIPATVYKSPYAFKFDFYCNNLQG